MACSKGYVLDVSTILQRYSSIVSPYLESGLQIAVNKGHSSIVEILVKNGARELNEALVIACKKNRLEIAEILVKNGANPYRGFRYSNSLNITRMLNRYKNNTENIYS